MQDGQLSVALLLSDLNEVKDISAIFRKLGVMPHFYEDLKTFWTGTLDKRPSLCIVDVKLMSEGELALHDHPAVLEEKLPIVFFYSVNTEPLLISTYDFFHLGLLKKSEHYEGQLRALLKRFNHQFRLERDNQSLRNHNQELIVLHDKLEVERQLIKQTEDYQMRVKDICLQLEDLRGESDFFRALEQILQSVEEIEEFALLELSFNGQKLMSPLSQVQKFRAIPSLWLGQTCVNGMEMFAQNMATQVAVEVIGGDLVSLSIKGNSGKPDKMLFIKSKNELFFNQFDWNMFEAYLNGFYSSFKNKLERNPIEEKKLISSFEAMSFIDQYLFGEESSGNLEKHQIKKLDYQLIDLDLSHLVQVVLKKSNNRFFWSRFEKEFINKLEISVRFDFRVFEFGVQHLGFLVESKNVDTFFEELKKFAARFSYWKYFEDAENALAQMINPKVTMVPLSAFAFINATVNPQANSNNKESANTKLQELVWERETFLSTGKERIHEI